MSQPVDALKREADQVADRVMEIAALTAISSAATSVQRKCTKCEDKKEKLIQTRRHVSAGPGPELDTALAVRMAEKNGVPLAAEVRSYFEPRVGLDLSGVRVHTDALANSAARALGARAFTRGRDIFFAVNRGPHDRRLLAHEIAHVSQQAKGRARRLNGLGGDQASRMNLEAEADERETTLLTSPTTDIAPPARPLVALSDTATPIQLALEDDLEAALRRRRRDSNPGATINYRAELRAICEAATPQEARALLPRLARDGPLAMEFQASFPAAIRDEVIAMLTRRAASQVSPSRQTLEEEYGVTGPEPFIPGALLGHFPMRVLKALARTLLHSYGIQNAPALLAIADAALHHESVSTDPDDTERYDPLDAVWSGLDSWVMDAQLFRDYQRIRGSRGAPASGDRAPLVDISDLLSNPPESETEPVADDRDGERQASRPTSVEVLTATGPGEVSTGAYTFRILHVMRRQRVSFVEAARSISERNLLPRGLQARPARSAYLRETRLFEGQPRRRRAIVFAAWDYPSGRGDLPEIGTQVRQGGTLNTALARDYGNFTISENPMGGSIAPAIRSEIDNLNGELRPGETGELLVNFQGHGGRGQFSGVDGVEFTLGDLEAVSSQAARSGIYLVIVSDACFQGLAVREAEVLATRHLLRRVETANLPRQMDDSLYSELRDASQLLDLILAIGPIIQDLNLDLVDHRRIESLRNHLGQLRFALGLFRTSITRGFRATSQQTAGRLRLLQEEVSRVHPENRSAVANLRRHFADIADAVSEEIARLQENILLRIQLHEIDRDSVR